MKKIEDKYAKDKKYSKVRDYSHYTGEYRNDKNRICNLSYNAPEEIPILFHDGSKYDYQFTIEEFAEEFKMPLAFLGKNAQKYKTHSVPIEKEITRIGKKRKKHKKHILQITI